MNRIILSATISLFIFSGLSAAEPSEKVDFEKQIKPIFQQHCASCHTGEEPKGNFSIATRESLLQGGDSGPVETNDKLDDNLLLERLVDPSPDVVMPPQGEPLDSKQIELVSRWLGAGAKWAEGFEFKSVKTSPLALKEVEVPDTPKTKTLTNPIDRLLVSYFEQHKIDSSQQIDDRTFARRVWLDLAGLLPPVDELEIFLKDKSPDKREKLVDRLLDDKQQYAEHWLTFWNDSLRNAYRGTGFIDDGRRQITGWLYSALYHNKPYDEFVYELLSGTEGAEGFTRGIKWRGVVNASQRTEVQAAQNLGQVFLGTNLKCASCHDSFTSDWKLKDAWALSNVFALEPLEIHHCDKGTGEIAEVAFLYPQLGTIDAKVSREEKMKQLATIMVKPENGRMARTIANRLWAQLMGRGIIDPVHEMDRMPWNGELLEWLSGDLVEHDYNLKHTLKLICTSQAYQMPTVPALAPEEESELFKGPFVKRMSAEQFLDSVNELTRQWKTVPEELPKPDGRGQGGQLAATVNVLKEANVPRNNNRLRASLEQNDTLMQALGRSNREQVVMERDTFATTLQALELTNGAQLDDLLKQGAKHWQQQGTQTGEELAKQIYQIALSRQPTAGELKTATEMIGSDRELEGLQDLLWIVVMMPEFQLIY